MDVIYLAMAVGVFLGNALVALTSDLAQDALPDSGLRAT